jgi:lanthanide-dependent methanol dehydrogenase
MAPIVVNNKVLVGNSGGELGVRGWLAAPDANSGLLAWKAYSTGPDTDVLIGPNFKPFYDTEKGDFHAPDEAIRRRHISFTKIKARVS